MSSLPISLNNQTKAWSLSSDAMRRQPSAHEEPTHEPSDEERMLACKRGDSDAFVALAHKYAARVVGYCLHFTRDRASAEEAAQDTWLGIWSSRASYEPSSRFSVLLFVAARNRCHNVHRSKQRARAAFGAPSADDIDAIAGSMPSALEHVLATERSTRLTKHVEALPPKLREALVLRVVDELPYADVGAVLDIPEATARTRVHLAVQQLRELAKKETP